MDDYHWNEVKNRLTMAAERKEGRREGRLEGRAEGEHKKAVEIAKKALNQGLGADVAAQITGLTIDEILRL
jgi:predicted transposase/invertase (TIGR01784 family)